MCMQFLPFSLCKSNVFSSKLEHGNSINVFSKTTNNVTINVNLTYRHKHHRHNFFIKKNVTTDYTQYKNEGILSFVIKRIFLVIFSIFPHKIVGIY